MDKSEIVKQVKQYGYTYAVKYKYHKDDKVFIKYYCSDSYEFPTEEIEVLCEFEEGDEYEILYRVANDFNSDDYLSDAVIYLLQGDCEIKDKDYAKYQIAYIKVIYNECWYKKDEGDEYKKNVLTSVLKYLDLRKKSPLVKYVADEILKIFGIEKDKNLNVRKQIELILDAQANDNVLNHLISPNSIKAAQCYLDKIGEAYKITEEESLYRVGVLFLRIHKAFRESRFLRPRFIKDNDKAVSIKKTTSKNTKKHKGEIRNYTEFVKLLASYYGINTPTYREHVLRNYKEKGDEQTLFSVIKKEHEEIWNSIL